MEAAARLEYNRELIEAMKERLTEGAVLHKEGFQNLTCGIDCEIKPSVQLDYEGGFVILGDRVVIADEVKIRTHSHPAMKLAENWIGKPKKEHVLVIKSDVFIGDRCLITPSCNYIAEGSIIGMGAVLTKDIEEPYCIWGGNPAKKIGERT